MSVYAEFDDRFRPRPPIGRLAILSFCHFVIAAWIGNALVSTADMAIWRVARVQRAWVVYLPPWTTLKSEAIHRVAPVARNEYLAFSPWITGGLVLLGALLLFFWPGGRSLGKRLFFIRMAQCIALFGAGFPLRRTADLSPPVLAELAVAAIVVLAGEWSANAVVAQVIDLRRFVLRLGQWLVRAVPGAIAIGVLAYFAAERIVLYLAAIFIVLTFFAAFVARPARYEKVENPTIGAATATAAVLAALVLGGCGWTFGFLPLRAPRVVVITPRLVRIETWERFAAELPGMLPAFDIHWTTPAEKASAGKPRRWAPAQKPRN